MDIVIYLFIYLFIYNTQTDFLKDHFFQTHGKRFSRLSNGNEKVERYVPIPGGLIPRVCLFCSVYNIFQFSASAANVLHLFNHDNCYMDVFLARPWLRDDLDAWIARLKVCHSLF